MMSCLLEITGEENNKSKFAYCSTVAVRLDMSLVKCVSIKNQTQILQFYMPVVNIF